jgi:hypothetical protein
VAKVRLQWTGVAMAAMLAGCEHARTTPPGAAMTPDQLSSRLVLVDGQQGFVGETGTITTVEQDGRFSVADFVKADVQPPSRTGRLSTEALGRLARVLASELGPTLPATIAGPPKANPRRVRIRYGSSDTTLVLPPGADLEDDAVAAMQGSDDPTAHVLRVWKTVRDLVAAAP